MHVVIRDEILKRTFTWQRLGSYLKSCCGGRSDFAMSQNRHPFVDVQTPRGDGQPSATFQRCAEISSDTEEMCSTTAPQGMQGKTFVAKTEERRRNCMETCTPNAQKNCNHDRYNRNRLMSELSVTVTCSRVPFLEPVLVKPRSSTIALPKCIQSQNLSLNTSQLRSIQ